MTLKDLLEQITRDKTPVLLKDRNKAWEACDLLGALSEPMLKRHVHMQPGLYIAMINDKGYLGEVLFKIESKPA